MEKPGTGGRRVLRVEKEIREVVAAYIISGFSAELQGLVSVSRVIASKDLRTAKVLVSIMGTPLEQKESMAFLQKNARHFQSEINRQLRMKYCPRVSFLLDDSLEHVMKVEKILHEISLSKKNPSEEESE